MTIKQISEANTKLQELVEGITAKWNGKGGVTTFEAYRMIYEIYNILNRNEEEQGD